MAYRRPQTTGIWTPPGFEDEPESPPEAMDGGGGEPGGEGGVEDAAPPPNYMTQDQMQQLLDQQAQQLNAQFNERLQQTAQAVQFGINQTRQQSAQGQAQPQQQQAWIPSEAEMTQALEEGRTADYVRMQRALVGAVYQEGMGEFQRLRQEGLGAYTQVSQHLVESVPEYREYREDVNRLIRDWQIPPEFASNPRVVTALVNSAKGAKMEEIVEREVEARLRQRNLDQAADVAPGGRAGGSEAGTPDLDDPFTQGAYEVLRDVGRTPEQLAASLGYQDWQTYGQTAERVMQRGAQTPKWRRQLNQRQNGGGRGRPQGRR